MTKSEKPVPCGCGGDEEMDRLWWKVMCEYAKRIDTAIMRMVDSVPRPVGAEKGGK